MRRTRGVTLLELMIVVAIVAILAAVAYPSYGRYVERTRRADGREMLMRVAAAQERFFTNRNRYATTLAELGVGSDSSEGFYTLADPEDADQAFEVTASPQGIQGNDKCGDLTINNLGNKSFSGDESNGRCW